MADSLSSLHTALDLHQLDPSAKEDRPYLISLMRRMGYTEVEIADVVSGKKTVQEVNEARAEPAPQPEPVATVSTEQVDAAAPRLIELEYGGAEEVPEFEPVRPKVHPTTEYAVEEVDEEEDDDNEFTLLLPDDDLVEFTEEEPVGAADDDREEEFVVFEEIEPSPADDADGWDNVDDLHEEPLATPQPEPEPEMPSGHEHNGFNLYRRELDGGQHVYFYSKKRPSDAEPADIPDGYAVQESEESGLPYLARA